MPIKHGAPKKGEQREALTTVTFKVDSKTFAQLRDLEHDVKDVMTYGKRSVVIRRAIRELWERAQVKSEAT